MADPGIQKGVGLGQHLDRLTRISVLQKDDAFESLGVRLRLGLQLSGQARTQGSGSR